MVWLLGLALGGLAGAGVGGLVGGVGGLALGAIAGGAAGGLAGAYVDLTRPRYWNRGYWYGPRLYYRVPAYPTFAPYWPGPLFYPGFFY